MSTAAVDSAGQSFDFSDRLERLRDASTVRVRGRVADVTGLVVRARVPGVRVGEMSWIHSPLNDQPVAAEVVGFRDGLVHLMALGAIDGIGPDSEVHPTGKRLSVPVGDGMIGRVVDGLGRPVDGLGPLEGLDPVGYPLYAKPPDPMRRRPIRRSLPVGVRAIDACLTLGEGQRMGIFAGAGHGKSTLLAMMARNATADVNVIAMIGERGREVIDFLEQALGAEGLRRSIVVVATSDEPALLRLKAAFAATAIAEYYRDRGQKVLFLMDSVTRFARAQREIGLAVGEPPARGGFPPSVFALLPTLLERAGNSDRGSITALYTVLVEGDDLSEPIADEVRSILDGHVVLDSALAARGHFPAISILKSTSRLFETLATTDQKRLSYHLRDLMGAYEKNRELVLIGAYQKGADPLVDEYLLRQKPIREFLRQQLDESESRKTVLPKLVKALTQGPG